MDDVSALRDALADWCDWDIAEYHLAVVLGIIAQDAPFGRMKGTFWSNNPVGNFLYQTLEGLVSIGVLEYRDEPDNQFRWNPASESLR
jgi:hypothetical protein